MIDESKIAERYAGLGPELNERQRRLWAAAEARACGRGGIAAVARATGIGQSTVARGVAELGEGPRLEAGRVRRVGAGRPRLTESGSKTVGRNVAKSLHTDRIPRSPARFASWQQGQLRAAIFTSPRVAKPPSRLI